MQNSSESVSNSISLFRFVIGLLSLTVIVFCIAWWIYVSESMTGGHSLKVERYLEPFPSFLQDARLLTWVQLAFGGTAFAMFYIEQKRSAFPPLLSKALMYFTGILCFWLLFTLM